MIVVVEATFINLILSIVIYILIFKAVATRFIYKFVLKLNYIAKKSEDVYD